ncbi:unnamed protein product [Allacma fusca]|uniref:Protein kinase domain-containing protein n=1 Tax=Allacma fusca TaxID=39272 RepID=A0A8J2L0E1_9HEXA|nr:unnamed protein product [Allacma fusca]
MIGKHLSSYDVPRRVFQPRNDTWQGLLASATYESSIGLTVSSEINGSILCMKLGNRTVSSEIKIHGGKNTVFIKSLQGRFLINAFSWNSSCNFTQFPDYCFTTANPDLLGQQRFGLVIKESYDKFQTYLFCKNGIQTLLQADNITSEPAETPLKMADFLRQKFPAHCYKPVCFQQRCANPFHCRISAQLASSFTCPCTYRGSGIMKVLCNDTVSGNLYNYVGVNEQFPKSTPKIAESTTTTTTTVVGNIQSAHQFSSESSEVTETTDLFESTEKVPQGAVETTIGQETTSKFGLTVMPELTKSTTVPIREIVGSKLNDATETAPVVSPKMGTTTIIAVLSVLLSLLLVACIFFGLRFTIAKKTLRDLSEQEIELFRTGKYRDSVVKNSISIAMSAQLVPFQNDLLETDVQIETGKLIEQDDFISVYPATINGRKAIVKTTDDKAMVLFFKEFLKDIKVMNHISQYPQPNIVTFLGAVTSNIQNRIICAGFEASSLGNVKDFLRNNSGNCVQITQVRQVYNKPDVTNTMEENQNQVTTLTMLHWSDQIATAMVYLQSEKLVHGDLSASNVFLFPENHIKISDVSSWRKEFERDYYFAKFKPPPKWRWMAIELLRSKKFTLKTDMWAFGVTLWEIFSLGEDPHPGIKWSPDFVAMLEKGYRMDKPAFATPDMYQVLLRCWYRYPNDRLNFVQMKGRIRDCIERFMEPSDYIQ